MSEAQSIYYSGFLAAAGFITLLVALLVWQTRRHVRGAKALIALLLALSWWDGAYAIFWAGVAWPSAFFWIEIIMIGVVAAPTALFVFACQVAQADVWLSKRMVGALMVQPLLVVLLLFTDPWHGLFYSGQRAENVSMIRIAGPVFWMNVVYSYSLVFAGILLLLQRWRNAHGIYRRQIGLILGALGLGWLNSLVYIVGFNPLPGADSTPFSFSIVALLIAFAIYHYHLFDVVPVARSTAVDIMSDVFFVIDNRNRILDMNSTAMALTSREIPDVIGRSVVDVFGERLDLVDVVLHEEKAQAEISLDISDQRRWYDLRIWPIYDERRNQLTGRILILREITELYQTKYDLEQLTAQLEERVAERTEALAAANERLMELDQMKDEFISRISHELRTPLTNVQLYLHLLQRAKPEKRAAYLSTIRQESDQLQRLIEDLLAVSYFSDLGDDVAWEEVDLNQLVRELIHDHERPIKASRVDLVLDLDDQEPVVLVERSVLRQAVTNVLINAYSFAPGTRVIVRTGAAQFDGDWVTVTIQDDGGGLSEEDRQRIFERFYRGTAAANFDVPGVGLGMSLVEAILQHLGGEVAVESEVGRGTCIYLRLRPAV